MARRDIELVEVVDKSDVGYAAKSGREEHTRENARYEATANDSKGRCR